MVVIGGGLVGLVTTLALARRGVQVLLVASSEPGAASTAAAGMLAPGVEHGSAVPEPPTGSAAAAGAAGATVPAGNATDRFAVAARDFYLPFLAQLESDTGERVHLDRGGILDVALEAASADALRSRAGSGEWLDPAALRTLEPALAHAHGALLHHHDGYVDNVHLVRVLAEHAAHHEHVRVVAARATALEWSGEHPVVRAEGVTARGETVVLAAGAWSGALPGLPRALPVRPVRGQLLALAAAPLRHVTYGPSSYAVPRGATTVVGSTMESVGFDATVTQTATTAIRTRTEALCPALGDARVCDRWAGLRPVTPDLLPILGRDPDNPRLVYACGHSRNGILLGPLSAECVAAVVANETPPQPLHPFRIDRFLQEPANSNQRK
ncbi:MAG TPA: FAD-dependent oxidoreductase [Gemmatimonadaceae bacterium]|nr:FAD-dependent oxidoreductase [Gemmatimonadaceae bacterium]